jgi:hypothetical protein
MSCSIKTLDMSISMMTSGSVYLRCQDYQKKMRESLCIIASVKHHPRRATPDLPTEDEAKTTILFL